MFSFGHTGGTSTSIDPDRARAPPPPPTLVYFPQNDVEIEQRDDWIDDTPDLFKNFASIAKPSDIRPTDVERLNVSVMNEVELEDLIPLCDDGKHHLPPEGLAAQLDPTSRRKSLQGSIAHEFPLLLSNGHKAPGAEDFVRIGRELSANTEDALRVVGRRKLKPGRVAPGLNHTREFFQKLELVSQYWDTSLDDYQEVTGSPPPSPTSPRSTVRRMSLFMTDNRKHQPAEAAGHPKVYKGFRKSTGSKMPDSYRSDMVRAFLKQIIYLFHCQMSTPSPRKTPQLEVNSLLLPVTQTFVVWRTPESKEAVRGGFVEGPMFATQARHETQFVKNNNTSALDYARECACLLLLAQERAREGKPKRTPGAGAWYTGKKRWGGGPGGEFGEADGNKDEHPKGGENSALKRGIKPNSTFPHRQSEEEIWKELKPNQSLWEPRHTYLAIGKSPNTREDTVFMVSSLFHHIAIVRLDIDPLYLEWLTFGHKPPVSDPNPNWYKPTMYRSRWYDMLDRKDRVEAFRGLWGMMSRMMRRIDGPSRAPAQRQHSEAHHLLPSHKKGHAGPSNLTAQRSHSVAF